MHVVKGEVQGVERIRSGRLQFGPFCDDLDAMLKEKRFHGLKLEWGIDQFLPLNAFDDASNGYLVEDTCVCEDVNRNSTKLMKTVKKL
ncbi:hypothetical protein EZV62_000050 [Acer yangbiense]|uniref:MATH domain-containing protein n=1 Tax=Acer yangbiense TaxID=1000413 RepID=A0A5C7IQ99_9ROSI|nr:hypothetical protein EZV62_000050 [Acer yangbiense]